MISFNPLQVGYKLQHLLLKRSFLPSFNPLQVGYKLYSNTVTILKGFQFQSLIGWLQTLERRGIITSRYLFQSLIGWLQTSNDEGRSGAVKWSFNPLQVGYKLIFPICQTHFSLRFNPLQVGYKPRGGEGGRNRPLYVSIPYRLATNLDLYYRDVLFHNCFNPLQVGYKLRWSLVEVLVIPQFQSLIGWLQTLTGNNAGQTPVDSFNPLQVGYKLKKFRRQHFRLCQVSIPYRLATN